MITIHYLGPEGTFSEQAVRDMAQMTLEEANRQSCEFVPHQTLSRAMTAVCDAVDANAFAVVPYYNLIEGLIQETLDLLIERELTVFSAMQLPVCFAIGGFVQKEASVVQAAKVDWPVTEKVLVFSHPKGLAQCSDFLQQNLPVATWCESTSTSQAVKQVAEDRFGLAVARRETLEQFGLPVLANDVGNRLYSRHNYTEFLLVGRASAAANIAMNITPNKTTSLQQRTLIAVVPAVDYVGLLADILGQIAFFGINLFKIHSRPAPTDDDGPAPQMFYLETDTPVNSPELRLCFETLEMRLAKQGNVNHKEKTCVVRILGEYELLTCQATKSMP